MGLGVFDFVANGLESCGIVEREVGKYLAVNFNTCFMDETHELGVGEFFGAGGGVDALNPEGAEVVFFVLAVAVGVGQTFFPSVFGNGPNVFACAVVATGEFQNFFATFARSDVVH